MACIWVGVAITRSVSKNSLSAVPTPRWASYFFPVNSALNPMNPTARQHSMVPALRVGSLHCPNVFTVIFVHILEILGALKSRGRCTLILGRQCILICLSSASVLLPMKRRRWAPSVLYWTMAGLTIVDPTVPGWVTGLWIRLYFLKA